MRPNDFNSYGARRGNHNVMMRGTFANVRIKNILMGGKEGGNTIHYPSGEAMSIYDAAMRYKTEGVPLVVFAGKEYGTGSSRDWAAKGTRLLGIRAVIAQSFERIHRSNLVGMGVLPLVFADGQSWQTLGLTGKETITIRDLCGPEAAPAGGGRRSRMRRARPATSRSSAASIRRRSLATTGTAAFCRLCCATWRAPLNLTSRLWAIIRSEDAKSGHVVSPIRDLHLIGGIPIFHLSGDALPEQKEIDDPCASSRS